MDLPKITDCNLKHVALVSKKGKRTLEITLSGNEMVLAETERQLNRQPYKDRIGFTMVEHPNGTKNLKITVAAEPEGLALPDSEKPAAVMEIIHDITHCRLGYLHIEAETYPLAGKHSAGVLIEALPDPQDRGNLTGHFSMEIIRRKQEKSLHSGLITDPHNITPNSLRLLQVQRQYNSSREALHHASETITELTRNYAIYKPKRVDLRLIGFHSEGIATNESAPFYMRDMENITLPESGLDKPNSHRTVTIATLAGEENALTEAEKRLKNAFPRQIFLRQRTDNHRLKFILDGESRTDPIQLLEKIHQATHCTLPVDIVAGAQPDHHNGFSPSLTAEVSEDVPVKDRASTARTIAGYVGLKIPSCDYVIQAEHPEYGDAPRVVVIQSYPSEQEALERAQDLRAEVVNDLNKRNGLQPGL